jgi:hypothetical protein
VVTIVSVAIGVALMGWHAHRFQNLVRPILTIVLVASLLFGLLLPEYAIHQETEGVLAGAWHGLSSHKNGFGDLACIGLIFWAHAWLAREQRAPRALLGVSLALVCLVLSRSSTALVGAMFAMLFLVLLLRLPRAFQRYMPFLVVVFILALVTYAVAMLQILPGSAALLKPLGVLTGKDMTFTGRTMIWAVMTDHLREHPLLGIGYGAYWTAPVPGKPAYDYVQRLHFYPGLGAQRLPRDAERPGRGRHGGAVRVPDHVRGAGAAPAAPRPRARLAAAGAVPAAVHREPVGEPLAQRVQRRLRVHDACDADARTGVVGVRPAADRGAGDEARARARRTTRAPRRRMAGGAMNTAAIPRTRPARRSPRSTASARSPSRSCSSRTAGSGGWCRADSG